jgi:type IV secretory pathway VirD2 relaxase
MEAKRLLEESKETGQTPKLYIDEAEAHQQHKHVRDKAAPADQPKPMLLCEDITDQKVLFGS